MRYGVPVRIYSDNGKEFVSSVFDELMKLLDVQHVTSPPYNPQSNSVERFHRSLHQMLRVLLGRKDYNWDRLLPSIAFAYNTKVNSSTQLTPALVFFGREARLPIDLVIDGPPDRRTEPPEYVRTLLARTRKVYQYVMQNQEATIRRNSKMYENGDRWKIGMHVLQLTKRRLAGKPQKITSS